MPELPEVETVRRGLEPHVIGQDIVKATIRERRLRWPIDQGIEKRLKGRRIMAAERRSKYLILVLDSGDRLILHLGMSGRLRIVDSGTPVRPHDHVDLTLSSGRLLRLHDPRRFGAMLWWPGHAREHRLLTHLGPEPFDPAFDGDYLFGRARGRRAAIKNFVMDGRIVVGVGNIYASESLFRAGIRPGIAAGRISLARHRRLADSIRSVLAEAVEQGGTTLRDFVGADGLSGYFQQSLFVYGREGQACLACGTAIRKQLIGQRSSFYCPNCQR